MDSWLSHAIMGPRRRRLLHAVIALCILALAVNGIFGSHGLLVSHRMKLQARQAQQAIQKLNQENQALAGQVRALKSDPNAIERAAREQIGLVKPGDLVFKLSPKQSSHNTATTPTPVPPQTTPGGIPHP